MFPVMGILNNRWNIIFQVFLSNTYRFCTGGGVQSATCCHVSNGERASRKPSGVESSNPWSLAGKTTIIDRIVGFNAGALPPTH